MSERNFDIEWSPINLTLSRLQNADQAHIQSWTQNMDNGELIWEGLNPANYGMAVYYQKIDLSQLTEEGMSFTPKAVNVQRPWTAPEGQDIASQPSINHEEYLYVFSAPLPNQDIDSDADVLAFRNLGLDVSVPSTTTGWYAYPDYEQCIFAQSTFSQVDPTNALTVMNGLTVLGDATYPAYYAKMRVAEQNTWGSMSTILGPFLHCYRVIIYRCQNLAGLGGTNPILGAAGSTSRRMSPVTIRIMTDDADLSEGEYLIAAANAYNKATSDASNQV